MKYAYTNCTILDGTRDMEPRTGLAVITEGENISAIVPETEIPEDCKNIDLQGAYLLPGLINLHVHLATDGKPPKQKAKAVNYKRLFQVLTKSHLVTSVVRNQTAKRAKTELMSGVTTIRTVGGILDFDGQIRDSINKGDKIGPRILAGNWGVSVPGGHFAGSLATEANTPEEAAADVRRIAASKPDLIKLMVTGGVMDADVEGEPGVLRMPPEIIKAACDEAHKLGFKVAAHVESPAGLKAALENGVDTIEHGSMPDEEILQLFKDKKAADICTISPALPYALFELDESRALPVAKSNGKIVMDGMIECAKLCLENDIPVGIGNDVSCPFVTHYNFWRELCYFKKFCNVSSAFALHTATLRNAEIAGIDDITGSIEEGKSADMVVVKDNPLDDLKALKHVEKVVMRGRLIENPSVKRIEEVDKLLDKYM